MVDSPSTLEEDLLGAAELLTGEGGISWAYRLLDDVAARHQLSDAWLVLGPVSGSGQGALSSSQVFGLGGAAVMPETAEALLRRPPGVYGEPNDLGALTSRALGAMCAVALRASVASLASLVDLPSGLSSTAGIEDAVSRVAACAARYGWSSTLLLLTTTGDASEEDRWRALAAALRQALRTGDEAGVAAPGVALGILANAGPEAVRPFVARVRAALSEKGWTDVDLHAATARTPEESVDPSELIRLAEARLADARGASAEEGSERAGPVHDVASTLELELRMLPGVVSVGMGTPVVVVARSASDALYDQALRLVLRHLPQTSIRLLSLPTETAVGGTPATDVVPERHHVGITGITEPQPHASRAISATAPGGAATGAARVVLLDASFDIAHGMSEVSLAFGTARGTGRAPAGPLAGGAQATLNALSALGMDVPFYLVSAERAHGVPSQPVVVTLAPKRTDAEPGPGAVERLGVASDPEDVAAASRATLGALNRHLARLSTLR
jgi:hypothetical protein